VMYTPVPSYMEPLGWVNRYIKPGGLLEDLCYLYDEAAAEAALASGGFKKDAGTGKYYWDKNGNNVKDPGEAIKVKMWVRSDHEGRKKMGEQLAASMAKIGIDYELNYGGGGVCYQHYMLEKDGTLYTAGWIFIGPEPDFLYDLFHSSMHWHSPESSCPNTMFINDPVYDTYSYNVKFATSLAAANTSAWAAQQRFAEQAHAIPLYCNLGVKASRVKYLGDVGNVEDEYEGKDWWQIVNEQGFGTNSWYTFLNAQPEGFLYGSGDNEMSIRYGWSSVYYPTHLNILYAEWYWDFEILGKIYDTLATRDPNMRSVFLPWMVKTWETGKWPITPTKNGDKLRITLRPDIKWHDGTPVTVADLYFTFAEVTPMLLAKGYPPPWWYSAVQYLISCYIVDPYTIEMLFSVESVWIEGWVLIASPIVPKHVWKPIIETGDPTLFQPDLDMIGSGPFKLVGFTPETSAELEANRDYFRYLPVEVNVHAQDYKFKFLLAHGPATAPPPPHEADVTFTITLHNLFLNASEGSTLTVEKYVYIDGALEAGYPITVDLQSCVPHTETITKTFGRGRHSITVAAKIVGPDHMTYEGVQQANPWLDRWVNATIYVWVTIVEDIASVDAYWLPVFKNAGVQHPDNAVGMKDLYECVLAFGTSPGHPKWNSICDINGDYKADMKDLYGVVLMFGKW
ncbi:MAG: ABC transporter substrate-binding protein, partial [Candidatus Bathyarchaeia archaeon]